MFCCKHTREGREYVGTLSMTISGRQCQAWASNTPHRPREKALNDANYPDGSRAAAKKTTAAILLMIQTDLGVIRLILTRDGNIAAFHAVTVRVCVIKEKNGCRRRPT